MTNLYRARSGYKEQSNAGLYCVQVGFKITSSNKDHICLKSTLKDVIEVRELALRNADVATKSEGESKFFFQYR